MRGGWCGCTRWSEPESSPRSLRPGVRRGVVGRLFAVLLSALFLLFFQPVHAAPGDAAGTVRARVEVHIEQQLTLERRAFDARMKVLKGLESVPLEDGTVDVTFADGDGNTVRAISDSDDDSGAPFIGVDCLDNVDFVDGDVYAQDVISNCPETAAIRQGERE